MVRDDCIGYYEARLKSSLPVIIPRMRTIPIWLLFGICLFLAACSMHVIDIQQGTIMTPEMTEQLRPGMTRNQVKFVMGTPTISDPFHQNRWDYIYTLKQKRGETQRRHIALFFEGDELVRIVDDAAADQPAS